LKVHSCFYFSFFRSIFPPTRVWRSASRAFSGATIDTRCRPSTTRSGLGKKSEFFAKKFSTRNSECASNIGCRLEWKFRLANLTVRFFKKKLKISFPVNFQSLLKAILLTHYIFAWLDVKPSKCLYISHVEIDIVIRGNLLRVNTNSFVLSNGCETLMNI